MLLLDDMSDKLAGLAEGRVLHAATQTWAQRCAQPSSTPRVTAAATATALVTAPAPASQPRVSTTKQLPVRTKPRRQTRRHRNTNTYRAASPHPLACPFYKRNPKRYHACAGVVNIHNSRSVRQHVLSDHLAPIYCPICSSHFPSAISRDEHIRARSCPERELTAEAIEGATDDQVEKLLQWEAPRRSRRGMMREDTEEASWFWMWDVLFPGAKRPKTVRLPSLRSGKLSNCAGAGEGLDWE